MVARGAGGKGGSVSKQLCGAHFPVLETHRTVSQSHRFMTSCDQVTLRLLAPHSQASVE